MWNSYMKNFQALHHFRYSPEHPQVEVPPAKIPYSFPSHPSADKKKLALFSVLKYALPDNNTGKKKKHHGECNASKQIVYARMPQLLTVVKCYGLQFFKHNYSSISLVTINETCN